MEYITLQELQQMYKVSDSTARRIYKAIRDKEPRLFQGKESIKKTPITKGKYKILLLKSLIDSKLNKGSQTPSHLTSQVTSQTDHSTQKALDLLEQQLTQKDNQISDQAAQIKDFHKEFQFFQEVEEKAMKRIIELQNQLLESKEENKRLTNVLVHRTTLLEEYTKNNNNSEESSSPTINIDHVEDVNFSEKIQEENPPINPETEKTFLDWINQ